MYDDILVPTDGSEGVRRAVEYGVELARKYDARLHALYVVDTGVEDFEGIDASAVVDGLREEGEEATGKVAEKAEDAGVDVVTSVDQGTPSKRINGYVADHDVEMVVMGTHGRTGIQKYLLGSVAERVVRTARVPVMTVRRMKEAVRLASEPFDDVLVPTDGSQGVSEAVKHGIELARKYDATLHALYVVDTTTYSWSSLLDSFSNLGENATKEVARAAAEKNVETVTEVVEGTPHDEILGYAETNGIDLVSMGTHGRRGLDRLFLGSVASKVVRSSDCPVLTARVAEPDVNASE